MTVSKAGAEPYRKAIAMNHHDRTTQLDRRAFLAFGAVATGAAGAAAVAAAAAKEAQAEPGSSEDATSGHTPHVRTAYERMRF